MLRRAANHSPTLVSLGPLLSTRSMRKRIKKGANCLSLLAKGTLTGTMVRRKYNREKDIVQNRQRTVYYNKY